VLSLIIEGECLPHVVERTAEFGAKQMAESQALVRYQFGIAVSSAF
jgi:hypothetical protein